MNGESSGNLIAWLAAIILTPILTAVGWVWHAASGARASASDAHEKIARLDERARETKDAIDNMDKRQREGFDGVYTRLDAMADSFGNRLDATHDALTRRMDEFVNGH